MTAGEREVLKYLKLSAKFRAKSGPHPGFVYHSIEAFLLATGRFWTLPDPEPAHGIRPMTERHCFDNAYKLALRRRNLRYVEGYAMSMCPVHHAWCVDAAGQVIDPTWCVDAAGQVIDPTWGRLMERRAYFGTVFTLDTVRAARTPQNTCVLNDYQHDWPVLRRPYDAKT